MYKYNITIGFMRGLVTTVRDGGVPGQEICRRVPAHWSPLPAGENSRDTRGDILHPGTTLQYRVGDIVMIRLRYE